MKGDKDTKFLVKETLLYSDGTETVVNFKKNENADVIEKTSEVEVALHRGETPLEEFVAPEPIPEEVDADEIDENQFDVEEDVGESEEK